MQVSQFFPFWKPPLIAWTKGYSLFGIQTVLSHTFYTYLNNQGDKNHSSIFILSKLLLKLLSTHPHAHKRVCKVLINVYIWNTNFIKKKSFSTSGWQCLSPESDSRCENNEEFLHSTNISWIPTTFSGTGGGRGPWCSHGEQYHWAQSSRSGWNEDRHPRTHSHSAARLLQHGCPSRSMQPTAQAQDVHDQKVSRPSRETQRYILRVAKELTKASGRPKPELWWTLMQTRLSFTIEHVKLLFWKMKCVHFRKPLTWQLWKI